MSTIIHQWDKAQTPILALDLLVTEDRKPHDVTTARCVEDYSSGVLIC